MSARQALPETETGTIEVIKRECGEAFWRALRQKLWAVDAKKARIMGSARSVHLQTALYHQLVPGVRAALGGTVDKPAEPQKRTIILRAKTGETSEAVGWSLAADSALVAMRNGADFASPLWRVVHVASGFTVSEFEASSMHAAARHAARMEAACPSVASLDPHDAESVAAFRAERDAFQRGTGA